MRYILEAWEKPEVRRGGVALLRAGIGNKLTTPLLSGFPTRELLARVARVAGDGPDGEFRASLVASQIAGSA